MTALLRTAAPAVSVTAGNPLPPLPEIARARYLDADFHRAEIAQVFRKSWLMVGHVSEFAEEGSYRLLDIPFAPVFVVRDRSGGMRAFLNSCQHRGATVLKGGEGVARALTCQYHGWTYDLSGRLVGMPDREGFPELRIEDKRLAPLRCELWGGFVFINFDNGAPALLDWIAPIAERYDNIATAPLRLVSRQSWEIDCNWKIVVDAFRETYHIDMVHRDTLARMVEGGGAQNVMYRNGHFTLLTPYRRDVAWDGVAQQSGLRSLPGIDTREYAENVVLPGLFPSTLISIQVSGFPVLQIWPLATGRSRIDFTWYGMDWGAGPKPPEWDGITAAFDAVVREDLGNLAAIQQSLAADAGKGIPLAQQEVMVYQFHAEIDRMIGADNIPPALRVPDILGDHLIA